MPQVAEQSDLKQRIAQALHRIWGFEELRPVQEDVVNAALDNRDAVVVMPTGGGKSLCFQLPAIVSTQLTVVISPLIALMKDQVDALGVVGVCSAALNSSLSSEEEIEVRRQLESGELRLLYVSPERLLLPATLQLLKDANVGRFAVDEAHCISAWGHDFRPEFRQLSRIREIFPGVPVQAFTATATPKVQKDIAIQLKMERPKLFVGVFDRPNLTYRIVAKDDPIKRMVEAVERYPNEGVIVYCLSRKDTETVAKAMVARGIPAVAYHAGLPNDQRKQISEDFARERSNVVVATIAFGMGIDRSNVRCVIHECLPKSMEGYQQETGRAGRDGMPSECVLLYSHSDVLRLKRLLSGSPSPHHEKLLEEVRRYATSHQCRHKTLSEYFGQTYEVAKGGCGACDVCLGGMLPVENASEIGQKILKTALEFSRGFGAQFLVSVLVGATDKQIRERKGDQAKGYGIFATESRERVSAWVYQMLDLGLLQVSDGQYPILSVTDEGQSVLDANGQIVLVENVALLKPAKAKKSKSKRAQSGDYDSEFFEKLRSWRKGKAAERGVPPYVVLHDSTLINIAQTRPYSLDQLKELSGMGEKRAADFGEELIALVRANGETLRQKTDITPKISIYHAYFEQGKSIEEVMDLGGIKASTTWGHLCAWAEINRPASIDLWVDQETQAKVIAALDEVGEGPLKPIYEHLQESIPYEKIRLVRSLSNRSCRSKED